MKTHKGKYNHQDVEYWEDEQLMHMHGLPDIPNKITGKKLAIINHENDFTDYRRTAITKYNGKRIDTFKFVKQYLPKFIGDHYSNAEGFFRKHLTNETFWLFGIEFPKAHYNRYYIKDIKYGIYPSGIIYKTKKKINKPVVCIGDKFLTSKNDYRYIRAFNELKQQKKRVKRLKPVDKSYEVALFQHKQQQNKKKKVNNYVKRLTKEWLEHKKIIIAVDFDSTLCHYPTIVNPKDITRCINLVIRAQAIGAYVVLNTASSESRYLELIDYCTQLGIRVDSINETPIKMPYSDTKKVYANIYLDDRAGFKEAMDILEIAMVQFQPGN